jgi:hypothetical protein
LRDKIAGVAFALTTTYIVLAYLSPAVLFPRWHNIMVWLAVAATLACLPQVPFRWRSAYVYLMLGLTAAVPVSLIANGKSGTALHGLREFLVSGIVFFLAFTAVDTVRKLRLLAFAIVISAIFLLSQSLYGWHRDGLHSQYVYRQHIYDSQGDVIGEFPRLQSVGILEDPNGFAQYLLVAASLLTLAWTAGRFRRNMSRNIALVVLPAAFLLYGILVTHSRGGLIGLAVLVFFLLEKRFGKIISLALAGGLLGLLFWAGAAGPRPTSISPRDPATVGRLGVGQAGIAMARSSPLFGVGFNMFRVHNPSLTAHNALLLCLSELGIFGVLFWLGLIILSIWDLNKIDDAQTTNGIRIALFTFLATGLFLSSTYVMTFYLLIGMAAAGRRLFRNPDYFRPITET